MNNSELECLKSLNIDLSKKQIKLFSDYKNAFLEQNSIVNLISKNDENLLFEKHIFDSLAINLFFSNIKTEKNLLDIGTGGGFPSVPIAILYPKLHVYALDSIGKKIRAIENITTTLNLQNITTINDRVENINEEFDYVTSRAVAALDKIIVLAATHIKKGGYFIAYKSQKAEEELEKAQKLLKKYNLKFMKTIDYRLPLTENFTRNLIIFKKT